MKKKPTKRKPNVTILKNCPFCGGDKISSGNNEDGIYYWCVICGASSGTDPGCMEAIEKWNRRKP